ncbi:Hypothetical protein (Fragment) [Durusdinium trenchii]|uniref:Uncharacterized protein n=1 Tax=Durusdinium trenchii TaxID=1381693 RepID=A0ABP0KD81_9DINO
MRDINLDSALAILARGAAQTRDPLAAREGGCQLQLISEDVNQELLQGGDPKHRILAPVKGILRKAKGVAAGGAGGLPSGTVKQLRLSPEALEQRRFRFSVQLLQNHLDQLQTDDVHELITVLKCLQGGEQPLVLRSLRLLKAFLEAHVVLHDRALQQGLIESVVDVMRQQAEVDVLTLGVACLSAVLRGAAQRGMLGPEALNFCGRSEVPPLAQEDLVTSISKSGGVPAILDGMRRFPACEGLVEKGCLCVVLLTSGTEDNKVSADYAQGQHQESSVLLRSQSRRLVARLGGVELLMKAMQRFTRNEPLQRSCCAALGQLANEVKEVDVEQKVVQLLMQALRAPPRAAGGTEASSCARYGAQALRHFATHGETKSFIARLGGIEELHDLALRGLQAPSTNQQLRAAATEALGALCHLASKHPENKLRIFEAGCLELAFQALGSSTTAPAETAEGVEASEATEVPEPELAMAACGLLHNMSVDAAIRSHVVKLGGRAAAERLAASHPEGAVRNLAMLPLGDAGETGGGRGVLEAAGDPFGALFAQRTPGLAAPRRVASKRERKIASEVKAAYAQAEESGDSEKWLWVKTGYPAYEGELQLLESARLVGLPGSPDDGTDQFRLVDGAFGTLAERLILVFVRRSIAQLVENCRVTALRDSSPPRASPGTADRGEAQGRESGCMVGVGGMDGVAWVLGAAVADSTGRDFGRDPDVPGAQWCPSGYGGNKGAVAVRFELGRELCEFLLASTADLQLPGTILSKLQFDDDEDAMHSYTTTTTTAPETQPSNGEMAECYIGERMAWAPRMSVYVSSHLREAMISKAS